jgi:hypothetical protein
MESPSDFCGSSLEKKRKAEGKENKILIPRVMPADVHKMLYIL